MSDETDVCQQTHYGGQEASVPSRAGGLIKFQTECTVGDTFDPSITLKAGCPFTPFWDLGNGATATGNAVVYAGYLDAGPHTVTLMIPNIATWLTGINVDTDKIIGDFFGAIANCTALTSITTGDNTNLTSDLSSLAGLVNLTILNLKEHQFLMTGDIAVLAGLPLLTYFYAAGTGIHGDIASLAGLTGLTWLDVHSDVLNGGITGDLADITTLINLTALVLGNTFVTGELSDLAPLVKLDALMVYSSGQPGTGAITGDLADLAPLVLLDMLYASQVPGITGVMSAANVQLWFVSAGSMGWNQAAVDAFLSALYTNRAAYAIAIPHILYIGGVLNGTPSGIYQDDATPSTGLEWVYKLCNDPDVEGFEKWTITYWSGGADITRP